METTVGRELYAVWCDGSLENEEVRRDMIVMDPGVGITTAKSFPIIGVVAGHAKSITSNERKTCRVRRERDFRIVYISSIAPSGDLVEMTVADA